MPGQPYSDANAEDLESSLSSQFSWWLGALIGSVIMTAVLGALGFGIPARWTAVVAAIGAVLLGLNMLLAKMLDMAEAQADAGMQSRWTWRLAGVHRSEFVLGPAILVAAALPTPWFN